MNATAFKLCPDTLPMMMHHKPLLFSNITPVNPNGMTVVDLGDMDEGLETTRHSSLPLVSPTMHKHNSRGGRHGSLPPKLTKIRFSSPAEGLDEVSEGESDQEIIGDNEHPTIAANDANLRLMMSLAWHPATPARWLMRGDGDGGDGDHGDGKVGVEEFEVEEEEVEVKVEVEVEGKVKGEKVEGKGKEVEGEGEEVDVEGVEVEVEVEGDVVEVEGVEGEGVSEAWLERTKGEKPERTREREGSRGGGRMMVVKYEIHGDDALMTNMEGVVPTLSSECGLEQQRVRWLCDAGVIIAQMTSGDQLQLVATYGFGLYRKTAVLTLWYGNYYGAGRYTAQDGSTGHP
ncbi:hypothetical protein F5888DRAFT_1636873 [Russula emetica]|nr:hypothetical protein F5888DRAFT_1636873 [Russula emetica]